MPPSLPRFWINGDESRAVRARRPNSPPVEVWFRPAGECTVVLGTQGRHAHRHGHTESPRVPPSTPLGKAFPAGAAWTILLQHEGPAHVFLPDSGDPGIHVMSVRDYVSIPGCTESET